MYDTGKCHVYCFYIPENTQPNVVLTLEPGHSDWTLGHTHTCTQNSCHEQPIRNGNR